MTSARTASTARRPGAAALPGGGESVLPLVVGTRQATLPQPVETWSQLHPPAVPPTTSPHTLADLPRLLRARVVAVTGDHATAERLVVLGFAPGTEVAFVRRAPFVGPLIIDVRGTQICLRVREARRIVVVPTETP